MESLEILRTHFGFDSFRRPQAAVIRRVIGGEHALVIMPTGAGKSICYQVPALAPFASNDSTDGRIPLTLVLSPLIALMKDQVDALNARHRATMREQLPYSEPILDAREPAVTDARGIPATFINSSLSRVERDRRYAAIAEGKHKLLYVTPERFRKPEFMHSILQRRVRLLAVDEAHCISEWGHDFRPDYSRLREFRELIGNPTTIALTATATPDVQSDIVRQLGLKPEQVKIFHEGIDRPNLRLVVEEVWGDDEKLERIASVRESHRSSDGSGIVYFTLIRTLERFSERLRRMNIPHVCYHGDLERNERGRIQNEFMQGRCPIVLATPAFGMGIDKEDIRFVIHAEIPGSMEAWYQEIGRAGRDGLPSDCVLLYEEADLLTQMEFLRWSNPDAEFYERVHDLLIHDSEQVQAYGLEWMREKLHARQKHDRRLETALAMLERYDVIKGTWDPMRLTVRGDLVDALVDRDRLAEKLRRDQQKLLALVQFVRYEGDRMEFVNQYFGVE